ncbi:MAG: hypothetical protein OXS30_05860 [Chloroflexota bacterium]|nr:hypothetical protein [Chloroflexota bacterium]
MAEATADQAGEIPFPHLADRQGSEGPVETGFAPDYGVDEEHVAGAELMEFGAEALLAQFHAQLHAGTPWFEAMLDCIREWESPRETIDGREYVYLIEHEAFDWLLLAERICDSAPPGLLPLHEVEALLVDESPPVPLSEVEFQERLGTAKYWAHLNFLYGVRVEQALHLAMERILQKERSGLSFSHARDELDGDVFGRIYGARQRDLLREYRAAANRHDADPERIEHSEWQAFTYWLFRRRLERQDPARVASDTRQGMEMLYELEAAKQRRQRRRAAESERPAHESDVIDGVLVAVG